MIVLPPPGSGGSTEVHWQEEAETEPVSVSIVIPCKDGLEHTMRCLTARFAK